MICRHCSQWNADGAARCSFCDNALDSEVDQTRSGQVTAHHDIKLLKVPTSTVKSTLDSLLGASPGSSKLTELIVQVVVLVGIAAVMILYLTCHG